MRLVLFLALCVFSFSAAAQGWSNPGGFYDDRNQPAKGQSAQAAQGCVSKTFESARGTVQLRCSRDGRHKKLVNGAVVATWNGASWVYVDDQVISRDEFYDDDYSVNVAGERY